MNQDELRTSLEESRADFLRAIEGLSSEEILEPGVVGEWSVRDVIQHLSIWEAEAIQLTVHVRRGLRPPSERFKLAPDVLNAKWHAATRNRPLARVLNDFHGVRKQMLRQVAELADSDLTRPPTLPWMKGRPLGDWIAGDTFLHEREHTQEIRAWRAARHGSAGEAGTPDSKTSPQRTAHA